MASASTRHFQKGVTKLYAGDVLCLNMPAQVIKWLVVETHLDTTVQRAVLKSLDNGIEHTDMVKNIIGSIESQMLTVERPKRMIGV